MSRLNLSDTMRDVFIKMGEGNPGAISAMLDIVSKYDSIDPQAAFGGYGAIMLFDTWEIYGSSIYVLYNDKCNRNVRKLAILQRACQLGHIPCSLLKKWANDEKREHDIDLSQWEEYEQFVISQLEDFQKGPSFD